MKKLILLSLTACLFLVPTADAQILKNLKKKVGKAVENTVTDNAAKKASEETDKAMNKMWEKQLQNGAFPMGSEMVNSSQIPATYEFDWEYILNMKTAQGDMEMIYYIKEGAPYVGMQVPQAGNMFTVLDEENALTVIYMTSDETKMVMASRNTTSEEVMEEENPYSDLEFEETGTKTILGYECRGYRAENADHVMEFYVTDEAEISFSDIYREEQQNIPKGIDASWLQDGKGLMLEMMMTDKKNPDRSMSMTCTGLEQKPLTIVTADYRNMNPDGN